MAEIPIKNKGSGRQSPRIDLTPMVDLGFLLITFFMLTTMLNKPVVMALVMPEDDGGEREPIKASKVLTLIPVANDQIIWYEGEWNGKTDTTNYAAEGLRQVILDKKQRVEKQWGVEQMTAGKNSSTGSKLYVLIKPTANARYENVVNVLDEMAICQVRYYALDHLNLFEKSYVEAL